MKELSSPPPEKRDQDVESNEIGSRSGIRAVALDLFRNPAITEYDVAPVAAILFEGTLDLPREEIDQLLWKISEGKGLRVSADSPDEVPLQPDRRRDLLISSCAEIVTNPATKLTLTERQDAMQDTANKVHECFEEEFGKGGRLHSLRLQHASHNALRRSFSERRDNLEAALEGGQLTDKEARSAELALQAINESSFNRWPYKFNSDKD